MKMPTNYAPAWTASFLECSDPEDEKDDKDEKDDADDSGSTFDSGKWAAKEAELQSTIKEKEDDLSEMAAKFRDNAEREGKSA